MQRVLQQLMDKVVVEWLANTPVMRAIAHRAVNAQKDVVQKAGEASTSARAQAAESGGSLHSWLSDMKEGLHKLDSELEKAANKR